MYARHFTFKVNPGMRSEVEALADQTFGFMKTLQGFVCVHFVVSEDDENEHGSFSLWESKEDAEAGAESIRSKVLEALEKLLAEPPKEHLYEVYKPKV